MARVAAAGEAGDLPCERAVGVALARVERREVLLDGREVAAGDRAGERLAPDRRRTRSATDDAHERRERFERARRTRGREPLDLAEQRDEVVRRDDRGRVVLRPRPSRRARTAASRARAASSAVCGIAGHRGPRARAAARRPIVADGNDCSGCSAPTRTSGRASSSDVEHVDAQRAGEMHARARPARATARPVSGRGFDRAVGRRDDHERRARGRRRRRASAPRRGTGRGRGRRRVGRAAGDRRRRSSRARAAPSAIVVPARPGPTNERRCACCRASMRAVPCETGSTTLPPLRARLPTSRSAVDEAGRDIAERCEHEAALPHPRVRDREVGRRRSRSRRTSKTSTSSVRGPQRSARTRVRRPLELVARVEQRVRIELGVDRDDRVEVRVLRRARRPARSRTRARPRRPSTRRRRASASTASCRCASRSPRLEPSARYAARVPQRSMRTRDVSRPRPRTGGSSLRTSTTTPFDARVGAAHFGDARREPLEQLVTAPTRRPGCTAR